MKKTIQRELFRNKYYMTYRLNGKVIDRKRWGTKSKLDKKTNDYSIVDKETAFNLIKERGSFSLKKRSEALTNVVEHTNKVKGRKVPRTRQYSIKSGVKVYRRWQYQVTFTYGNKQIVARSDNTAGESVDTKRDKAYERALGRLNKELNRSYEDNAATDMITKGKVSVKEEVVYYAAK